MLKGAELARRVRSQESLVVLTGVLALFALGPLKESLATSPGALYAATLILYLTPGMLLARWFLRKTFPGVSALPVAFVLSTGLFGMLGVPILAHVGRGKATEGLDTVLAHHIEHGVVAPHEPPFPVL